MAVLKLVRGEYRNADALDNLVDYVLNKDKMPSCCYGGRGISLSNPLQSMKVIKNVYGQITGKQAEHFIIAFDKTEIPNLSLQKIYDFAYSVCEFFEDVQTLFSFHEVKDSYLYDDYEKDALHLHFVLNPISLRTGYKIRISFDNEYTFKNYILNLLVNYGITDSLRLAF